MAKRQTINRAQTSTSLDKYLLETLNELSKETRIPKSLLFDEALELLFEKHNKKIVTEITEQ